MAIISKQKIRKSLYIFLGLCFLALAYFGIIMPGVPAIPFILIALFFFANSSKKLHNWMLRQKIIAKIIGKNNPKKGALAFKLFVISQLWVSIFVAEYLFVTNIYYRTSLIILGIVFSYITYKLMENTNGKE